MGGKKQSRRARQGDAKDKESASASAHPPPLPATTTTTAAASPSPSTVAHQPTTTLAVRDHPVLGYKLRVLLYDLVHVAKDPASARRLDRTTDAWYMSRPYFAPDESETMKNAIITHATSSSSSSSSSSPSFASLPHLVNDDGDGSGSGSGSGSPSSSSWSGSAVRDALASLLSTFFDKRRASGDARPCGPHHLAPLYAALYGIDMAELQDGRFLGRLRRNGV
ncbi:hypothetical protein IF1G_10104 [Cordyceps javanica]|uniref:Uncharacterized protein n=1 Tax=Cordyceps javanica TaxID=43265 RepID=A0A545UP56_9HYPO|nr:hypothetical protein IF1G_10104 [Cordyceps javanica]TQW02985.1 hypothetical protein IF2G_09502 [Cordyceps javanica]